METTAIKPTFKKYPAYRDSGVEWLGEIPEHWELKRFKFLFKEINEKSKNGFEELLSVSQYTGVTKKSDKVEEGGLITTAETLEGYKKVKKNDLVSNIMLAWNGSLGFSQFDGITSPAYSVYRMMQGNHTGFFHYLVRSKCYTAEFKRKSSGVIESRLRLYTDDFYSIISILPPFQEQTAIANFLDDKTAKIDLAIAQKEKMIALLKERKQIIIQNAVTKGLNPNAKMKDSGVEWIGEIPEGWEVKKLKHISNVVLGKMICNQNLGGMELKPYRKSKNIQWLRVDLSSVDEMYFSKQEMELYRLRKNDLVLSEGGEVGKTCIWNNELLECYIQNSAQKVSVNNQCNPFYYLYLFNHIGKQGGFESIINRVSIGHLTKDKLMNIRVTKPPLTEQISIVDHIEVQSAKIDKAINLQEQQIEKLKELKSTLIDSAVTGKIKVC